MSCCAALGLVELDHNVPELRLIGRGGAGRRGDGRFRYDAARRERITRKEVEVGGARQCRQYF